jgi:ketosteroid isomerase-like protein
MKRTTLRPSTLILFSALIMVFFFAGRSIGSAPNHSLASSPGRSGGHATTGTDSVSDDIDKLQEQIKEAFISGDSSIFLKCYAPDACVLAPNTPIFCGQRGVSQFFRNTRQAGIRDAAFHPVALFGQTWEYVTQQGAFEVFNAAGQPLAKGKVLILFKKTDEGWKIFRQSLNFDAPPPAPPPAATK